MSVNRLHYPAEIDKEAGSDYCVVFPDLPGCVSAGDSIDDAILQAHEALAGHIALMIEDGDALPAPSSLEDLAARKDATTLALTLIPVTIPGRAKRVNITLDEALLAEIDAVTDNRSRFLAQAARTELLRQKGY
jgi:predicted RNase H-like HicB family nuclease